VDVRSAIEHIGRLSSGCEGQLSTQGCAHEHRSHTPAAGPCTITVRLIGVHIVSQCLALDATQETLGQLPAVQ